MLELPYCISPSPDWSGPSLVSGPVHEDAPFFCPETPSECAFCSVAEEAAKKDYVKLVHHPTGAHGDASDTVSVKLHRSQWTVQPPDGKLAGISIYTSWTEVNLESEDETRSGIHIQVNVQVIRAGQSSNTSISSSLVCRVSSCQLFSTLHWTVWVWFPLSAPSGVSICQRATERLSTRWSAPAEVSSL